MTHSGEQHRVRFDFEIEFGNGGGLQGRDFRLDIDGDDIDDAALAELIVRDLRLLMVSRTRIFNKVVFAEAHKRPIADAAARRAEGGWIDLSHVIEDGLVTYPDCPPRGSATTSAASSRARVMPKAPSSRSGASTSSPTPAPISIVRSIATPTATTSRRSGRRHSPISTRS
jgi:hypothetical protein